MKNLNFESLYKLTVFLVFSVLLVHILIVGQSIIVPLLIAFFIAFLLIPLANFLERYKFPRPLSAITCIIITIVLLAGVFTLFGSQVNTFVKDLDDITDKISELKSRLPEVVQTQLDDISTEEIIGYAQSNSSNIFSSLTNVLSGFTLLLIIPIYIAMILIYRNLLRTFLLKVFNVDGNKTENTSKQNEDSPKGIKVLIPRIKKIIQKYIVGMFYVICVLFVLNSIALFSLGIQHAMLFAAIAAVLNIIPFVGPLIGSTLPIMFALITKDSLFYPLAVMASFIIIQSIESNFLTPKIVGSNVSLNPLVTLITLFVGASIWGIVGMILFIPMVAIIKEILRNIDGLEPYAYLLGNEDEEKSQKEFIKKAVIKLKDKLKK
jgi:predicted PurR-regulated permease PerM